MDVVIHCMGMPFGPKTIYEQSLGGSETAAYYLARGLAARGARVSLFTTRRAPVEEADGVTYIWLGEVAKEHQLGEKFEYYARNTPHDVLIVQRHPLAFTSKFNAKVCIWQLHDLALRRSQPAALTGLWQVDAITCVSEWHRRQVCNTWGLDDRIVFAVPNGVDPALYQAARPAVERTADTYPPFADFKLPFVRVDGGRAPGRDEAGIALPANKFVALYQARPERGLEHLVRPGGIMERAKDLPLHLVFCGYENTTPEMAPYYQRLFSWAAALPNVSFVGALTKPQLAELQRKCDLMLYATEFEEVSCISAMEAMHAGLPMLTSAQAALPETCAGAGVELLPLKDGGCDEDAFVARLREVFGHEYRGEKYPSQLQELRAAQLEAARSRTWERAVDRLEDVIGVCFERRVGTNAAVLRSALERSDVDFARWYYGKFLAPCVAADEIEVNARDELHDMYEFTKSDAKVAQHYARHTADYYDEHEDHVLGEDVTRTLRFMGVGQLIEREHELTKRSLKVLDFGCAHGHYLVPLAKDFSGSEFHGVDVSERAVAAAQRWIEKEGLKNVKVKQGGEDYLESTDKRFDVVIAGEILEHARDWRRMLKLLRGALAPDGCLIITTPAGPWERADYLKFRTWREHLVHFEKEDIREICKGHPTEISYAPASHDRVGEALGSWVWHVRPVAGVSFSDIDYGRKFKTYAPRQTISACLIVKDGEQTLRKCVESFVDWVDEVRVCVDPATKDRTLEVATDLSKDFKRVAWMIKIAEKSAIVDGFDEARNESIAGAAGDWIMWCDADEEVHAPWALQRLARASMHDGYGFAQMHYALEPPQVLTTDYPCRFFRNGRGIKFYGVVHEHPELKMGDAIPTSIVRPEVKFLHCGYVDEDTRRKRFQRNWPLVQRDLEKYPDRKLTKFLWLRDLAQNIVFEQQQMNGLAAEGHLGKARDGIAVFEKMIDAAPSLRMVVDALQYYSHCVQTLGGGFDASLEIKFACQAAPGLGQQYSLAARFHDRKFYQRLVAYLLEESTKTYEDKYL